MGSRLWFAWPRIAVTIPVLAIGGWLLGTFAPPLVTLLVLTTSMPWGLWQIYDLWGMTHGRYVLVLRVNWTTEEFPAPWLRYRRMSDALELAIRLNADLSENYSWEVLDRPPRHTPRSVTRGKP